MLKIVSISANSPIQCKTVANGLMNITSLQWSSPQSSVHRDAALCMGDRLTGLSQLKRNLTCFSHACGCPKCSLKSTIFLEPLTSTKWKRNEVINQTHTLLCTLWKSEYPIKDTYSVLLCGVKNTHFCGLFSAIRYKEFLLENRFQNYFSARNYSKDCDKKDGKSGKDGKGGKGGKEKDNLSAVLYAVDDLRLEQRPIPKISDTDVLLAMDCVGICGSDVHYWVKGRIGDFVLKKPMVIGHEGAGIVEQVGKKVKHLKKGDRVAIEPGYPCRMCDFCKQGMYNLCPGMIFCATPPYDGNLCRYYKHPADFCFKIPSYMTMEEACLLEPLCCGVHACKRANVGLGSEAVIFGSGPIGLVTLTVAKSMGATNVTILDVKEDRLKVAKRMGANNTLLMKPDDSPKDLAKKIIDKNGGRMPDKAFDCVGTEQAVKTGIFATRSGGCLVLIGMGEDEVSLPLANALAREVDVRGIFRYCNDYKPALQLVASKKVQSLNNMITHHFNIEDTEKAFTAVRCNEDGAIKVIIHVQPRDKNNPKKGDDKGKDGKKTSKKC